jgi:steroid delta-isomerase
MRSAVETYLRAWAEKDKALFLSLFSEGASLEDPVGSPVHEGKEALGAFWDRVAGLGLDMNGELHRLICCGNECLADFTMRSTQSGMGMAVRIVDHFSFDSEGRFKSMRAFWDDGGMSTVP